MASRTKKFRNVLKDLSKLPEEFEIVLELRGDIEIDDDGEMIMSFGARVSVPVEIPARLTAELKRTTSKRTDGDVGFYLLIQRSGPVAV